MTQGPQPTPASSRAPETPGSPGPREPVDLDRVLAGVAELHRAGEMRFRSAETPKPVVRYARLRQAIQYAKGPGVRHAPTGGVTVGGTHYPGGEFIPGEVMAKATPAEKAKIEGRPAPGKKGPIGPFSGKPAPGKTTPIGTVSPRPTPPATEMTASPADVAAAKATPKIHHPTSDEDAARFIAEVRDTPVYKAVDAKIAAIAGDSPGGNPTLWSLGQHATGDVLGALKEHGHEAYDQIQWTPARRALHERILGSMLNPKAVARPGEKPKLVLLMGPPGSGKSTAGQPEAQKLGVEFTTINADDIKGKLPEYRGWNAAAVHEESGLLAEGPLMHRAVAANHNVLMDLTGGNTGKLEQIAEGMAGKGYDVHLVSVALPAYKSVGRTWDRFTQNAFGHADPAGETQELGRFVPPKYVHEGIDGKPEQTYKVLREKPYVKSYVAISNDVPRGQPPRVVDRGGR